MDLLSGVVHSAMSTGSRRAGIPSSASPTSKASWQLARAAPGTKEENSIRSGRNLKIYRVRIKG